jgi:glycosyltransferase involved in cell wall biosynthesis
MDGKTEGLSLRILHIIATLDRSAGGPANSIRRIVSTYPEIGSVGEVLTLDAPEAPFLKEVPFTVHALGPVGGVFSYSRRLIPWLRKNRDRFDGVVVHGLWQYTGYAVWRAVGGRKPYMVFTHGMLDPYFNRSSRLKQLKKIPYWLLAQYWVLRGANHVLFTSEAEARLATQSFWPWRWNPIVVPYGATAGDGDPGELRRAFLEAHPALCASDGSAKPFVLFLSRIHTKKGCDLLVEAFVRLAERAPGLQLVFAGPDQDDLASGLMQRAAEGGVAERVHLIGMVDGDQKWGAFHACEVFALPSHQENFGIAVAEALACGKAVLISDKVNIWEDILADGAAFVGSDDVAGTQKTLAEWIALPAGERAAMGERALACFRKRYDMRANAHGIVAIFARIAAGEPGSATPAPTRAKAL